MKTHIPNNALIGYTYCGRHWRRFDGKALLALIDLRTDDIESATCKACQRSDDRRTREEYRASEEYLKERAR